ncbi:hypothetical protein PYCC9005_001036 [Savitreella phatthalungensis]
MCLLLLTQEHPDYSLIILSNRDEYLERPTKKLHEWSSSGLYGGQDIDRGGTWLMLSAVGEIAALTNYRENSETISTRSRGELPFLFTNRPRQQSAARWLENLVQHPHELIAYGGFSLLCGTFWSPDCAEPDLYVVSNRVADRTSYIRQLDRSFGLTCELSNADIADRWPKCDMGRAALHACLQQPHHRDDDLDAPSDVSAATRALVADLFDVLSVDTLARPDVRSMSSSVFIPQIQLPSGKVYGTRQQTVILIERPVGKCPPKVSICERTIERADTAALRPPVVQHTWQSFRCES